MMQMARSIGQGIVKTVVLLLLVMATVLFAQTAYGMWVQASAMMVADAMARFVVGVVLLVSGVAIDHYLG